MFLCREIYSLLRTAPYPRGCECCQRCRGLRRFTAECCKDVRYFQRPRVLRDHGGGAVPVHLRPQYGGGGGLRGSGRAAGETVEGGFAFQPRNRTIPGHTIVVFVSLHAFR